VRFEKLAYRNDCDGFTGLSYAVTEPAVLGITHFFKFSTSTELGRHFKNSLQPGQTQPIDEELSVFGSAEKRFLASKTQVEVGVYGCCYTDDSLFLLHGLPPGSGTHKESLLQRFDVLAHADKLCHDGFVITL
jgi:hypothetical protein